MNKRILILAAILGLTSVIIGAFGAHGLKQVLNADQLQTFEVGVRYQMYHALFLLFIGLTDKITLIIVLNNVKYQYSALLARPSN